jgi:hypothetical protein
MRRRGWSERSRLVWGPRKEEKVRRRDERRRRKKETDEPER